MCAGAGKRQLLLKNMLNTVWRFGVSPYLRDSREWALFAQYTHNSEMAFYAFWRYITQMRGDTEKQGESETSTPKLSVILCR